MTNDTTQLDGALAELGENLANNLISMGVTDADAEDGLTTLAEKILGVNPSVKGLNLTTDITLSHGTGYAPINTDTDFIVTMTANYDDTSLTNVDLSGVLTGANVSIKEGNTTIGTGITNTNGVANISSALSTVGTHNLIAVFEGTDNFDSCTSNTSSIFVLDNETIFSDTPSSANLSAKYTYNSSYVTYVSESYRIRKSYYITTKNYISTEYTGKNDIKITIRARGSSSTANYNRMTVTITDYNDNILNEYSIIISTSYEDYVFYSNNDCDDNTCDCKIKIKCSNLDNNTYLYVNSIKVEEYCNKINPIILEDNLLSNNLDKYNNINTVTYNSTDLCYDIETDGRFEIPLDNTKQYRCTISYKLTEFDKNEDEGLSFGNAVLTETTKTEITTVCRGKNYIDIYYDWFNSGVAKIYYIRIEEYL